MIVIPIGSYFLTVHSIFAGSSLPLHPPLRRVILPSCLTMWLNVRAGNSTYAGALAAVMANVVLIGYIIVAMNEDQSEQLKAGKPESKKDQ